MGHTNQHRAGQRPIQGIHLVEAHAALGADVDVVHVELKEAVADILLGSVVIPLPFPILVPVKTDDLGHGLIVNPHRSLDVFVLRPVQFAVILGIAPGRFRLVVGALVGPGLVVHIVD